MFSSIKSENIPWRAGQKIETYRIGNSGDYRFVMRDFRQANRPNWYLLWLREILDHTPSESHGEVLNEFLTDNLANQVIESAQDRAAVDHASEVITRLLTAGWATGGYTGTRAEAHGRVHDEQFWNLEEA